MRILFISAAYPPNYSGIGAYTANMAQALAQAGHQVVVATCALPGLPEEESNNNITIQRCYQMRELRSAALAQRLLKLAKRLNIDIIESADFLGEAGKLLRLDRSMPVCIKAHNSGPVTVGREAEIFYPWQRWMQWVAILRNWRQYREEKYSLEHGDILTTPSHRLMEELQNQGLSLPTKRFVLANPINLEKKFPENREASTPTILFVGRLAIGKGIAYLPEIFNSLLPEFPMLRLVIAGADSFNRGIGSLQLWLSQRFGKNMKQIEFSGHLGRDELEKNFDQAWLIVVPSLWDTFPTVVLEAMAKAKPVVGSVFGGIPEMLERTLCPVASPKTPLFADEVAKLLRDKKLRKAAGHSMFIKAKEDYNPQLIAGQYYQKISALIEVSAHKKR